MMLTGRKVVIVGGSSGIGLATAGLARRALVFGKIAGREAVDFVAQENAQR